MKEMVILSLSQEPRLLEATWLLVGFHFLFSFWLKLIWGFFDFLILAVHRQLNR